MSTRSSQRSVVLSEFGDRTIIDLPDLGGPGKFHNSYAPHYTTDSLIENIPRGNVYPDRPYNVPNYYYYGEPNLKFSHFPQEQRTIQHPYPSYYTAKHIEDYFQKRTLPQQNVTQSFLIPPLIYKPPGQHGKYSTMPGMNYAHIPFSDQPTYSSQPTEIHYYYGPNGERLREPPRMMQTEMRKTYPSNFTLEGVLEFGKLVSSNIKRGNISFSDIPDFLLKDLLKEYSIYPRTKVKIVADDSDYRVYYQLEQKLNKNGYHQKRTIEALSETEERTMDYESEPTRYFDSPTLTGDK